MGVTRFSGTLRIAAGLCLLLVAVVAGFQHRSLWTLPLLAVAFTVAFVCGKARAWRMAAADGQMGRALLALPLTFAVQSILVGLMYLIGYGVGALVHPHFGLQQFEPWDWYWPVAATLIGGGAGIIIDRIEQRPASFASTDVSQGGVLDPTLNDGMAIEIAILPDPVTPQSFYAGIFYGHGTYSVATPDNPGGVFDATPNSRSEGSEAKIIEAETRLGVRLPAALRELYFVQNGGSVNSVCVPKPGIAMPHRFDDVIMPFSGYDDLYPTENIRSVHQAISDYADPEAEAERFPEYCQRMLILAQWYRETLFLDYRGGPDPKVGFVDLDDDGWAERCVWWAVSTRFSPVCATTKRGRGPPLVSGGSRTPYLFQDGFSQLEARP